MFFQNCRFNQQTQLYQLKFHLPSFAKQFSQIGGYFTSCKWGFPHKTNTEPAIYLTFELPKTKNLSS